MLSVQRCLDRLNDGDQSARNELFERTQRRFLKLARHMLRSFPEARSLADTNDVGQSAAIRLCRSIASQVPQTARDYFRIAAYHMRLELIDLTRKVRAGRIRVADFSADSMTPDQIAQDSTLDPEQLAMWTEFHEHVQKMPDEIREVFDLIWYDELSSEEVAGLLGVSLRTVQRRWRQALLELHAFLNPHTSFGGEIPALRGEIADPDGVIDDN